MKSYENIISNEINLSFKPDNILKYIDIITA